MLRCCEERAQRDLESCTLALDLLKLCTMQSSHGVVTCEAEQRSHVAALGQQGRERCLNGPLQSQQAAAYVQLAMQWCTDDWGCVWSATTSEHGCRACHRIIAMSAQYPPLLLAMTSLSHES